MPHTPLTPLDRLWLTEAVRLREEHAGPLEDAEANRQARTLGGDLPTLIESRALWLARRDGLVEALRHWRQGARLAGFGLVLLALMTGAGLGLAALGDGQRPVNVFWALGSLLGLNLLTLIGWALGLFLAGDGGALGRLWLWLSEKLARDARAAQLAPALLSVLHQRRLGRWVLGLGVHGLWTLAMGSALVTLLALLATRRYGFVWETTILGEATFISLTQALGALPALLGFSLPDIGQIRASGGTGGVESARQAWAGWLVGVVLIYGLLPRLLLALLCLWRWRRGRKALHLDLQLPAYRLLRERLQPPSERLGINDEAPSQLHVPTAGSHLGGEAGALLVAIELDDSRPWPPPLPAGVADAGILDDREQRRRLLEQMSRFVPARLVIACDPLRSPDRGTLALIGELSRCAGSTRVWLLQAPTGQALDSDRLSDWHQALDTLGLPHASTSPLTWLETGHD
ncbi:DUF2868 domain-containing protein [Stutzerimonas nosocomialis]|uniref:DUF2868 domain-containing protein n=1 Tax=Stutzerimonas nosocomialis TaxID=1056496 RepID=A0A5R9QDH7_9GAMM|nr:DUF2868 domain-containing protein [Stutzerimonas nosocomialis]TLX59807.1 DUF2868 domain-containing protein [Stutzerimonas nosocomialis]TLX63196.1 DUF2868 domain-containing protein [Stutzerimonas nosocomialis]